MQEKKLYHHLNNFADWVIRIILVNFLVIVTMLPIVTIIPALTSGYKIMSDALDKKEPPIFKTFFKTFKEDMVNKIIVSIIVVAVLAVSFYNFKLYSNLIIEKPTIWYSLGYYVVLTLIIAVAMIALYLPLIFTERQGLEIVEVFKLAFFIAGKFFFRTMLVFLTLVIPYIMFLDPILILLFVFMGVSIPLLLNALITKKAREFLQQMEGNK